MGWKEDLALGKKFELVYFENELIEESEIYQSEGKCGGWDLETYSGVRYEIKACRRWRSTGNILVEFACNHKDSGISKTTSDYWAFYQLGAMDDWIKVITVPTSVLKDMIKNKKYHNYCYGAQYGFSDFFLFKEKTLNEYTGIKVSKNPNYQSTVRA
jgi:hypothetical protein